MSEIKALFNPVKVGNTELKNRIGMCALTRNRAPDTYPTDLMKEYYVQRADAGLIITEGTLITRQGTEWPNAPGIWDDKHVAGWKNIVDAVHAAGGKIYSQLWHVGRASHPEAEQQKLAGTPVYAPSAISARGGKFRTIPGKPGYVTPTAIDDPQIIIQQFKDAAVNAKKAGFDGVELHGANGYIISQFLDSTSNKRTDKWGGSIENRSRFGLEVLKAVTEVWGHDVAIKLSPAGGYNDMGMPLQETLDTYSYFITEADKLGLSFFELVRYSPKFDVEFDGVSRATKHDVLESYRPYVKNAKLFLNADVLPEEGEALVAAGKIDGIFIGFNFITHPDLVKRVAHGKPLNNVPNIPHLQTNKDSGDWATGYTDYPVATY
ncbi:FMN-linked oxidoreductase [Pholiota conissans]|uniref:FMN-linked oxidoreductase n=1 Tax=Pholiota conissans TaxID=109636 RepID=A0A9P5Z3U0_9AGAR|nr:FMN-linked oxidoreductase [Pholiota conissans]